MYGLEALSRQRTSSMTHHSLLAYVGPTRQSKVRHPERKTGRHASESEMFFWSMHACARAAPDAERPRRRDGVGAKAQGSGERLLLRLRARGQ